MTRQIRIALPILLTALLAACAAEDGSTDTELSEPCGIKVCDVENLDEYDANFDSPDKIGKADAVDRVKAAVADVTGDGELDAADVQVLFEAAGGKVSRGEIRAIRDAVFSPEANTYDVTADAQEATQNAALTIGLSDVESDYLTLGYRFSGSETPKAVRDLLIDARLNGALAYDVNEKNEDGEGVWSPYPATTPATENMTFDYTEITPEKLQDDIDDVDVEYNAIVGTTHDTTPSGQEYERVKYEVRTGGTGNISAQYDHAYHPDIYARGTQGQKWANNFAILADGSVHCLPASRRSEFQDVILTNPHLSRGAKMLFNGHLDVREGLVVGVEMSGRLSKLAAKDKAAFIDPIPVLEAWGFEMSPNLSIRYGNTRHGRPVQGGGVIEAAP